MVCLGNICRSPMAHGLLQHKVEQRGMDWEVDSAGTGDWHRGQQPDHRAIACMKKHSIDITYQSARPIIYDDFQQFDLIYVMDRSNFENVERMARNEEDMNKVKLLLSEIYPEGAEVPDPYYGGDAGFERVYQLLDEATEKILERYSCHTKT